MAPDPIHGRRLIQNVVDELARDNPDKLYVRMPRDDWRKDGFRDITFSMLARGVNRLAWWLDEKLGLGAHPSIAYAGPHDLRYAFVALACFKTRRSVLVPDFRMTPVSRLQLFRTAQATVFLKAKSPLFDFSPAPGQGSEILDLDIVNLEDLLIDGVVKHYPFELDFEDVKDDRAMTIHTSGTTGPPKPIHLPVSGINVLDAWAELIKDDASAGLHSLRLTGEGLGLATMPCPWLGGLYGVLHFAIFAGWRIVILPPSWFPPYNVHDLLDLLEKSGADSGSFVPSTLRDIVKTPGAADRLSKLITAARFAGAPLDSFVGEELFSRGIKLLPGQGSTEMGVTMLVSEEAEEWMWYRFHPANGLRFDPIDDSDPSLCEMVVERRPELAAYQSVFHSFPGLQEYRCNDVYSAHPDPSKKGAWKYLGRKDDFVKLDNMTKFHSADLQKQLLEIPLVNDVIIGGGERSALFLLLAVADGYLSETNGSSSSTGNGHSASRRVDDDLWKAISDVNAANDKAIAIRRELIFLLDGARPIARTTKGTIDRSKTLALYEEEIAAAYKALGLD